MADQTNSIEMELNSNSQNNGTDTKSQNDTITKAIEVNLFEAKPISHPTTKCFH